MKLFPVILLILFYFEFSLYSQTVDFSASETEGCGSLNVNFTNTSIPSGSAFFWDFGDGQTSTLENPSIIYTTPGSYDVSLTIDGSSTELKTSFINVYEKPVPAFSSSSLLTGCAPLSVSFNGTAGASTITSWFWDFGDGNTSNQQNPVYIYDTQNSFNVSLVVVDDNNCQGAISEISYITVYKPVADFSAPDRFSCNGDLTVNFTNLSSALGATPTYFWEFGDGNTSSLTDPSNTYVDNGHYGVKLTVTDENSCINTKEIKDYVVLENVMANFSALADTICPGTDLQFVNLSTNANNYFWDFGDSTSSTAYNPRHLFSNPGNYLVTLKVSNSGNCIDTYSNIITVEEVIAAFELSSYFSCSVPVNIKYLNKSVNGAFWDWRFANKTVSSDFEPVLEYDDNGTFIDTLIVTSKHGCSDIFVADSALVIKIPRAYITPNTFVRKNESEGCIPLTVNFKDESNYITTYDYIDKRVWDFGDGTSSTAENPSHQYTTINEFVVTFELITKLGCKASTVTEVRTGDVQKANFSKSSADTLCASQEVQFTDLSNDSKLVNGWFWKFGDGKTSTKQNPSHAYTDVGSMDVTLLAYYNGCPSKIVKEYFVFIKGPYAEIDYTINCETPYNAIFSSKLLEGSSFRWEFGDGSANNTTDINPVHTYGSRGSFLAKLHADNPSNGCSFDIEEEVRITDIKADFSLDKSIGCTNLQVNLNASLSVDAVAFEYNSLKRTYKWDFGDGSPVFQTNDPLANHKYSQRGNFPLSLTVRDLHDCENTLIKYVKTYKPLISFEASQYSGCKPMTVEFTNNTINDTTVIEQLWDFGDGFTSTATNPAHDYEEFGIYDVSLKVKNIIGCESVISKSDYIEALKPSPDFTVSDPTICTDNEVIFRALTKENITSYLWDFGDGNTSTSSNPVHTYTTSGNFNVSLSLIDNVGCDSSATVYNYISVQSPPTVDFVGDDLFTNCFPLIVNFTDRTAHPDLSKWFWDFGDGATSQIQNPLHIYNKPGNFDVSLIAKTSNGCSGLFQRDDYVQVGGPYAVIDAKDTICKNVPTTLIATNQQNVYGIEWFFDNGVSMPGDTAIYTYNTVGMVYPILLLTVDDAQTCDKFFVDSIYINELIAAIGTSDNNFSGCVPFNVSFQSNSTGAGIWSWNIDTATTSDIENPYFTFYQPGDYDVRLVVSDELGCLDTTNAVFTAFPLPVISISADTLICLGESVSLIATGGEQYSWLPNYGLSNNLVYNPIASPRVSVAYTVFVTDTNNCTNTGSNNVLVQQEPEIYLRDTTIIIGETVILDAYSYDVSSYSWTSDYDITCPGCPKIDVKPLSPIHFYLEYSDTSNCFIKNTSVYINVVEGYTVDVPQAFTPNGDGINDIVYVRGWGIKELIDFSIFNRFGAKVFESQDLSIGWDGSLNGNSQNIETFSYVVKVKTYEDKILTKTGTIKLLK